MKTSELIESFEKYLKASGRGYGNNSFISNYHNPKDSSDNWHPRFDIRANDKYIQSFLLICEQERLNKRKYPFYRSFEQQTSNGKDVKPACFVVVYGEDKQWHIYGCNCLDYELKNDSVVNYTEAVKKFNKRWDAAAGKKELRLLKILCWFFALCCFGCVVFSKALCIPINTVVVISLLGAFLTIFPIFAPGIKAFTIGPSGISYEKE